MSLELDKTPNPNLYRVLDEWIWMKHPHRISCWILTIFFLSQIIGLLIVNSYLDHGQIDQTQEEAWQPLPYNLEAPELENQSTSFVPIVVAILIGTGLVLLLIKLNKPWIMKVWFFVVIWITLSLAFAAFVHQALALVLGLGIALWRSLRPNIYIHNFAELFIYGGLAALLIRVVDVTSAIGLLLLISVYDMIAVWKTKHMVSMAKFQSEANIFAGAFIPYSKKAKLFKQKSTKKTKGAVAVLGGGDMGFPLIFAAAVLKETVLTTSVGLAFLTTLIIPVCTTAALGLLLYYSKKGKFYPAMPFLSVGCFVGYGLFLLF